MSLGNTIDSGTATFGDSGITNWLIPSTFTPSFALAATKAVFCFSISSNNLSLTSALSSTCFKHVCSSGLFSTYSLN